MRLFRRDPRLPVPAVVKGLVEAEQQLARQVVPMQCSNRVWRRGRHVHEEELLTCCRRTKLGVTRRAALKGDVPPDRQPNVAAILCEKELPVAADSSKVLQGWPRSWSTILPYYSTGRVPRRAPPLPADPR